MTPLLQFHKDNSDISSYIEEDSTLPLPARSLLALLQEKIEDKTLLNPIDIAQIAQATLSEIQNALEGLKNNNHILPAHSVEDPQKHPQATHHIFSNPKTAYHPVTTPNSISLTE